MKQAQDLVTRDAIFEVLRWQTGSFDFHAQPVEHDRDPAELLGAEQILMDGLRMVDEWQSFAQVPVGARPCSRASAASSATGAVGLARRRERANAERVFSLVDGRLSARRVIDLARLGTFDGMRALSDLVSAGVIERSAERRPRSCAAHARVAREGWLALRASAMALVPLAALAVVAWWTAASSAAPAQRARSRDRALDARESARRLRRARAFATRSRPIA